MKYDIKLIASDIDDTILPKGGTLSEETESLIKECAERKIDFCLASGRWYPSTAAVADAIGLRGWLICANGGVVMAPDGSIAHEFFMSDEDVKTTYGIIKDCGALITSYVTGTIYRLNTFTMENRPPEQLSYYGMKTYDVIDNDLTRFESEALSGVYKMEVYSNDSALLARLKDQLEDQLLDVSSSFRTNIEITSKGLGKGRALKWLYEHLGLKRENVMAFGDNTNDAPLLLAAGVGVAMGNAVESLKEIADEVADTCINSGLAKFVRENVF